MDAPLDILVVEDDSDTRANLQDILHLDAHRTEAVGSLQEMFENCRLGQFSCIILDRRLPDGTADEAIDRLCSLAPQAAVIVVTGYADLESTIAALRSGVADYILKPISPDALRASLGRLVRLRAAEERALQAERLAVIGQVVTSLAHESRGFLQKISCSAELLQMLVQDNNEALEELRRILAAEQGLLHLFEELRGYAAPMLLDKRETFLQSVWRSAWHDVAGRECRGELVDDPKDAQIVTQIDCFRMGQVFRNLFENAMAACDGRPLVRVQCDVAQDAVTVLVRDNGPGLDAEQRRRVFQPFFTTKSRGTGLGLAIAKRIIEAHGGNIRLGNSTNGAEFAISLPAH